MSGAALDLLQLAKESVSIITSASISRWEEALRLLQEMPYRPLMLDMNNHNVVAAVQPLACARRYLLQEMLPCSHQRVQQRQALGGSPWLAAVDAAQLAAGDAAQAARARRGEPQCSH